MDDKYKKYDKSRAIMSLSRKIMPGGVSSPVRAFKGVGGDPLVMARAEGSKIYDVDGHVFIDYVGSWGPLIFGHADPETVEALVQAVRQGTSFGTPTERELKLCQLIVDLVPSIEMVRLVNSGTEATMSALRLARGFTGRSKVIKFEGNYHGHVDSLLVQAGSGLATFGEPSSAGVPREVIRETLVLPYNDLEAVRLAFKRYGSEIAAIMVEPVAGNMGCIPPRPGFLEGLRDITEQFGALLIFDEVMTGFRVGPGGAQQRYEIRPDLTALGKIIGGGLPVGAYGGRREIMERVSPLGSVYQAGTLSGNPLATTAGYVTLKRIKEQGARIYATLEERSLRLAQGLKSAAQKAGLPIQINRVGSMMSVFFNNVEVVDYRTASMGSDELYAKYFWGMIQKGIYFAPSRYECLFVSTAHEISDIDQTIEAASEVMSQLSKIT